MKTTLGRSLGRRRTHRTATLVATMLTVLALAAPASATPPEHAASGQDWHQPVSTTTFGRSWS